MGGWRRAGLAGRRAKQRKSADGASGLHPRPVGRPFLNRFIIRRNTRFVHAGGGCARGMTRGNGLGKYFGVMLNFIEIYLKILVYMFNII